MDEGSENGLGAPLPADEGPPAPTESWWKTIPWGTVGPICGVVVVLLILLGLAVDTRISLTDKIHTESTEIRNLVGENAGRLSVLDERTNTIRTDIDRLSRKLDRVLDIPSEARAGP